MTSSIRDKNMVNTITKANSTWSGCTKMAEGSEKRHRVTLEIC